MGRLIDVDELIRAIEGENEDVDEFDNPQKAPRSGYSLGLLRRVIFAQHDEMSAQQYGDTWRKICKQHSNEPCVAGCPLGKLESLCCCALPTKETIAIVSAWAREHPEKKRKTYAEDFFEKFPKAEPKYYDGRGKEQMIPIPCRQHCYGVVGRKCNGIGCSCSACWNEEMEGEE